MKTAKTLPVVQILDDQGLPLIDRKALPFVKPDSKGFIESYWGPVPTDHDAARRYGREMALAFLRVAPTSDNHNRQSTMAGLVMSILNGQAKTLVMANPPEDGLVYNFAICAASEFWETVARFAEPTATLRNIEHWRSVCALHEQRQEMAMAAYEQECAVERSERAQKAAVKGWAKRRKTAAKPWTTS